MGLAVTLQRKDVPKKRGSWSSIWAPGGIRAAAFEHAVLARNVLGEDEGVVELKVEMRTSPTLFPPRGRYRDPSAIRIGGVIGGCPTCRERCSKGS